MMDKRISLVLAMAGVLFVGLVGVVALLFFTIGGPAPSPRAAFEAHLLALDEGRINDANALVDITCARVEAVDVDAAKAALMGAGYTFQTAFQVETVWLNERGTEAILELETPPNLPLPGLQGMMKVEGGWLLSCSG